MAYINVDHSKLGTTAKAIEDYLTYMKGKMETGNSAVNNLTSAWEGGDSYRFKNKWNDVRSDGSQYKQMYDALNNYANHLRFAEGKYKDAQTNAVNRANWLPK